MTDANRCYLIRATRKQAYLSRSKVGGALSIAGEATREYQKFNLAQRYRSSDTERNDLVSIIRRLYCNLSTSSLASLGTEKQAGKQCQSAPQAKDGLLWKGSPRA